TLSAFSRSAVPKNCSISSVSVGRRFPMVPPSTEQTLLSDSAGLVQPTEPFLLPGVEPGDVVDLDHYRAALLFFAAPFHLPVHPAYLRVLRFAPAARPVVRLLHFDPKDQRAAHRFVEPGQVVNHAEVGHAVFADVEHRAGGVDELPTLSPERPPAFRDEELLQVGDNVALGTVGGVLLRESVFELHAEALQVPRSSLSFFCRQSSEQRSSTPTYASPASAGSTRYPPSIFSRMNQWFASRFTAPQTSHVLVTNAAMVHLVRLVALHLGFAGERRARLAALHPLAVLGRGGAGENRFALVVDQLGPVCLGGRGLIDRLE